MGSQSLGTLSHFEADGQRRRVADRSRPTASRLSTLVPLARASVSASPNLPFLPAISVEPVEAELGVVVEIVLGEEAVDSCRAVRTVIGAPSLQGQPRISRTPPCQDL